MSQKLRETVYADDIELLANTTAKAEFLEQET